MREVWVFIWMLRFGRVVMDLRYARLCVHVCVYVCACELIFSLLHLRIIIPVAFFKVKITACIKVWTDQV